jgi:hypothetical protein
LINVLEMELNAVVGNIPFLSKAHWAHVSRGVVQPGILIVLGMDLFEKVPQAWAAAVDVALFGRVAVAGPLNEEKSPPS